MVKALAQRKMVGGLLSLIGQPSGAQIDRYNFETLIAVGGQIQEFAAAIGKARRQEGQVIDGAPCDDVKGALIHVSLADKPPGPDKDKLLAIPTGLTIPRDQVDLLARAGHDAITGSPALRAFLERNPAQPERPAKSTPRQRVAVGDEAASNMP
jgi:hypothetical protein